MDSKVVPLFYKHRNPRKRGAIRFKSVVPYDSLALKRGEYSVAGSFDVKVDEGKKFYDILWLQDVFNFAVSERIHDLLVDQHVVGWKGYPLSIENCDKKYWGIQVTGRAGPLFRPSEGFIEGLSFDQKTWDGSDIFLLEGTGVTLISERLRDILIKAKTTNLELAEISTIQWFSATADVPT